MDDRAQVVGLSVITRLWTEVIKSQHRCHYQRGGECRLISAVSNSLLKEEKSVIRVTRLNNKPFLINSDLIKFVEQAPDTLITLVNGEKIIVQESVDDIVDRIIQFRRSVIEGCGGATGCDPNLIATALTRPRHGDAPAQTSEGVSRG